ncbi:sigma-70 family RNA polymerase sigma factor [Litoricola sp.]|jgi:RNA polymerase sigma-70 factor (ECF subfamily)|nr:sigma-70 family RNA polymerase sigma factor [Litorivicinaceae bacterium]MDA9006958.1 sigma-70 family RNA polymerase sigma factor [Litorivicinus sp.]HBC48622.1 RNA polymerase sigma factor RpoE [Gammaproteobacteria bacterium]MDB2401832.1 sigma-70 family RNA polymerase sigma factor [Litorivicinaceae bacterium]MDB2425728.1 sigma-70 family RNA polymerase sigma factor [Litorivicinaceae bacterium]
MESPVQKVEAENDQLLVDRARLGDRHAFDLLVLKYQSRLLSLVNRLVSNQSDALDVLQDTFVKAYRSLHTFRGESAFYTWLYRIAVNTAKNHLASKLKESKDVSVDDEATGELSVLQDFSAPDEEAGAEELQRAILHAIEQLPDDLKQALTLRELEGMSYDEIALAMNCPIGTVRSRIFRARDHVVQEISQQFPGTFL